jgi:hypothetical protein
MVGPTATGYAFKSSKIESSFPQTSTLELLLESGVYKLEVSSDLQRFTVASDAASYVDSRNKHEKLITGKEGHAQQEPNFIQFIPEMGIVE